MTSLLQMLALSTLFACAVETGSPGADPIVPPDVNVGTGAVQDIRCAGVPDAGPTVEWRNLRSHLIEDYGESHHRGIDLIATTDDASQAITGRITYGGTDKDLEDENVSLFGCFDATWRSIGAARTDGDGRFSLALSGDARLPVGMRDLYVSVDGDRTGAAFLAYVAPAGTPMVASDMDGTLTASENEYPKALAFGGDVAVQADAPATLMSAAVRGVGVVYISARGDRFTQDTRDWLVAKGFPRGPLILPSSIITLPGGDTIEFKTSALAKVAAFDLLAGIGNRATDIAAYAAAGLPSDRIFIKLPEFTDELAADLAAAKATSFIEYDALRTQQMAALLAN
jgi:phosphatidate phosphatase PAH1